MIKRYHITLGAGTTAGGTVTSAGSLMSVDGARIALEGDTVACTACKADGVIQSDGPRLSERFNNRQVALSDDLCLCKCRPSPRLVNSQVRKFQAIDADGHALQAGAATRTAAKPATAGASASAAATMPLLLRDPDTQEPFRQRRYRLELRGKVIEGLTHQNGLTRPLTAAERASVLTWHVDGASVP